MYRTNITKSRAMAVAAGAIFGTASLLTAYAPAANADTNNKNSSRKTIVIKETGWSAHHPYSGSGMQVAYSPASANLPDSVRPIMIRAAVMLEAAQARQQYAPGGARMSYRAAAAALRQALAAGHYAGPSLASSSTSPAGLPMTASEIAADIQSIKSARANATPAQSAALMRVATFYATGAKEFFTGQLRDALFGTDNGMRGTIVIRGNANRSRGTGSASSSLILGKTATPRGVQQGGVIQPDGSVAPANNAPTVPNIGATPGSVDPANTVGTNVLNTPPLGIAPVATPVGDNPLNPVAPIVVPAVIPTAPVTTPPATPPVNPGQ